MRCKLANYNQTVNQVMSFKTSAPSEEVKSQLTQATEIAGFLRDIIWRKKHMSIKNKTRIYKTCVRPVMTYAGETKAENSSFV